MSLPRIRRAVPSGFSLVELVMVIAIMGILSASVAVFIANPVRAYFETIDRAALTGAGNSVIRRVMREVQAAVPNSARITVSGGTTFLEYVPIVDAGRYRHMASNNDPTQNAPLIVTDPAVSQFQVLGPTVNVPSGSELVVLNLGYGNANLYSGTNIRAVTSIGPALQTITFTPTTVWPGDSPGYRFYIVNGAVTYACTPSASGTGTLTRYSAYAIQATQPNSTTGAPLSSASSSLVLDDVTSCTFTPGAVSVDLNAVQIALQLTRNGETVSLYSQVHAPNNP
ncbi:MAG TPA: type II secretion system protein [Burkholderiaceae bacterium]|nr:type II secretion system protein [Burkholderiaceae bacterium]